MFCHQNMVHVTVIVFLPTNISDLNQLFSYVRRENFIAGCQIHTQTNAFEYILFARSETTSRQM